MTFTRVLTFRFAALIPCAFVACGLLTGARAADNAAGSAPIDRGLRIFVAGHSFHAAVRDPLREIALAAGLADHKTVGDLFLGGSRVIQIWNLPDERNSAKAALIAGKVDVLTLSPHRKFPDEGIDNFVELGLKHNPDLRVTVQRSWLPWDNADAVDPDPRNIPPQEKTPLKRDEMTAEKMLAISADIAQGYDVQIRAINKKYGKTVALSVPTGHAVMGLREKIRLGQVPGLTSQEKLFTDRMGHPGPVIVLLNAYCHYSVIYRRSPVGLPTPARWQNIGPKENVEAINRILQEIAWDTVIHDPISGVVGETAK